jgi:serine/threonine protein kinase
LSTDVSSGSLAVGGRLGSYVLEEPLGSGAMGAVYLARRDADGARVALKVMQPELAHDPVYRRRFTLEGRVAASVRHPHLVPVLEVGEADGRAFMASAFIAGSTLGGQIERAGRLDVESVVRLAGELAGALDALHAAGILHRDVKPSNILLDEQGKALLTDFGSCKTETTTRALTRPGEVLGTLDYLAPELVAGRPALPASDVYSLGAVLYEALTGTPPFGGRPWLQVGMAHLHEPPPDASAARADVPGGVAFALTLALAKEPADRPTCRILFRMLTFAARPTG